jgi:hypothetical protein
MIKYRGFPVISIMAISATGFPVFFKLFEVFILVASGTIRGQA